MIDGLDLSISTILLGLFMDSTISINSSLKMMTNSPDLYQNCYRAVYMNILVISPIIFTGAKMLIIKNTDNYITIFEYMPIILIHNVGYHCSHYLMHKVSYLRKLHDFHHQLKNPVIPSVGNAVSVGEFLFAYVLPFLIGAYVINPTIINFKIAIGFISFLNLIIHCEELRWLRINKYFVSPYKHTEHHHKIDHINDTYSAPFIDLDTVVKALTN